MEEKEMPDLENGIDPLVRRSHHIQTVVVVYRAIPGANYAALKLNGLINNQQNIYIYVKKNYPLLIELQRRQHDELSVRFQRQNRMLSCSSQCHLQMKCVFGELAIRRNSL